MGNKGVVIPEVIQKPASASESTRDLCHSRHCRTVLSAFKQNGNDAEQTSYFFI